MLIEWNYRDSNALLLLMFKMLLEGNDEDVIRAAAVIVQKLIRRFTPGELAHLGKKHQKASRLMLYKISKAFTYYTQYKLLTVLHDFMGGQEGLTASVFEKEKEKLPIANDSFKDAIRLFKSLDPDNFEMVRS